VKVNDNMRANADWMIPGSGSHWSLLVVFLGRGDVQFWHFDSVKSIKNSRAAKDIMKKVSTILQSTYTPLSLNLVNAFTPQQKNGFDCGVHMLVAAKVFSTMTTTTRGKKLQDYENVILEFAKANPDFCGSLRQEIVGEIIRLATMGKQR
jgi:sentrin-specific protease 8